MRESVGWIAGAEAQAAGVAIALDRQERGQGALSAAQEVSETFGIRVVAIAGLADMIDFLERSGRKDIDINAIRRYRDEYGCA